MFASEVELQVVVCVERPRKGKCKLYKQFSSWCLFLEPRGRGSENMQGDGSALHIVQQTVHIVQEAVQVVQGGPVQVVQEIFEGVFVC